MNKQTENLDRLISRTNKTLAKQGLKTDDKFPGTLCRTQEYKLNPEMFYLVLDEMQDGYFKVIPGNLDGFTAGPEDMVLPENIFGGYVALATDLICTLPEKALGQCFAVLDKDILGKIRSAVESYSTTKNRSGLPFGFGLPYLNAHETRKITHDGLCTIVRSAQNMAVQTSTPETAQDFSAVFKARVKEFFLAGTVSLFGQQQVSLAAGKEETQTVECIVEGLEHIALILEFDKRKGTLCVELFDKTTGAVAQEDCQNWKLFNSAGELLGVIDHGGTSAEGISDFDGILCLMDTDNGIHAVNISDQA